MKTYYFYETPVGTLRIVQEGEAISEIRKTSEKPEDGLQKESDLIRKAHMELTEYFEGRRKSFDLPLAPKGTDFQKRAWRTLLEIPYGETISYGAEARRMECRCARAVGSANGRNPIIIVIPCHRVINSNGRLGGYTGGLEVKEFLLELEKRFR